MYIYIYMHTCVMCDVEHLAFSGYTDTYVETSMHISREKAAFDPHTPNMQTTNVFRGFAGFRCPFEGLVIGFRVQGFEILGSSAPSTLNPKTLNRQHIFCGF